MEAFLIDNFWFILLCAAMIFSRRGRFAILMLILKSTVGLPTTIMLVLSFSSVLLPENSQHLSISALTKKYDA